MKELFLQVLAVAYAGVGVVSIVAYWPTMRDIYHHKTANITSYFLWTGTAGISFLYSLFILPDLLFQIVSGMNFGACMVVLLLSIGLERSR